VPRENRSHELLIAPFRADRESAPPAAGGNWLAIDAHRNFRGTYTAAGALVRSLAPQAAEAAPDLLTTHQLTFLFVAPEFETHITVPDEVARLLTFSGEGNSRSRTLRLANGLTDFLLSYAARVSTSHLRIAFENADHADPLDREFISVLLRRADPQRLTVRVCSSSDLLSAETTRIPGDPLLAALKEYARPAYLEPGMPAAAAALPEAWRSWLGQNNRGWAGEWLTLLELSKYHDLSANHPPSSTLGEFVGAVVERMSPSERSALAMEYVTAL